MSSIQPVPGSGHGRPLAIQSPTVPARAREKIQSFDDIARALAASLGEGRVQGSSILQEIQSVQSKVTHGKAVPYHELLFYQVKMSQLGLRVELLSKVAESASATMRKLQTGQ